LRIIHRDCWRAIGCKSDSRAIWRPSWIRIPPGAAGELAGIAAIVIRHPNRAGVGVRFLVDPGYIPRDPVSMCLRIMHLSQAREVINFYRIGSCAHIYSVVNSRHLWAAYGSPGYGSMVPLYSL